MSKRFTDTDKWLKNNWFIELPAEYKLFWLFLIDICDNIGIWECNFKVAEFAIGTKIDRDRAIELFDDRIQVLQDGHKWWIVYFCLYQYGNMNQNQHSNNYNCYRKALKDYGLWDKYTNTTGGPTEGLLNPSAGSQDISIKKISSKSKDVITTSVVNKDIPGIEAISTPDKILAHWNAAKIIQHNILSDKAKRALSGLLRQKYTEVDITTAITNYQRVLASQACYFKHKWTLQDFLARGFEKFRDWQIAKDNYTRRDKHGNQELHPEQKHKEIIPGVNETPEQRVKRYEYEEKQRQKHLKKQLEVN